MSNIHKSNILNELFTLKKYNNSWIINLDFINYFLYGFIMNLDKDSINMKIDNYNIYMIEPNKLCNNYQEKFIDLLKLDNYHELKNNNNNIIKSYDMDKFINNYLSLNIYVLSNNTSNGFLDSSLFSCNKTYFINDKYTKSIRNIVKMIYYDNSKQNLEESDGFIISQNPKYINEIIINEIIYHYLNNNSIYQNSINNIINYKTSLLTYDNISNKIKLCVISNKISGDFTSFMDYIYENNIYGEISDNKLLLFFNNILERFCKILDDLKDNLDFIHTNLKTNNIMYKIVKISNNIETIIHKDDFDNINDYNNIIKNLLNNGGSYINNNDNYNFYLLISNLDKSTLIYNNIRFNTESKSKFIDLISDMDTYNNYYQQNKLNLILLNIIFSSNSEYISYYSRNSPISIYNSYDYYILIYSLLKSSTLFNNLLRKLNNINFFNDNELFITKLFIKMYNLDNNEQLQFIIYLMTHIFTRENKNKISNIINDLFEKSANHDIIKNIYNFNLNDIYNIKKHQYKIIKPVNIIYLTPNDIDMKIILTTPQLYNHNNGYIVPKDNNDEIDLFIENNETFSSSIERTLENTYYFKTNHFSKKKWFGLSNKIYYNYLFMDKIKYMLYFKKNIY